jgi:hypothetical protein
VAFFDRVLAYPDLKSLSGALTGEPIGPWVG